MASFYRLILPRLTIFAALLCVAGKLSANSYFTKPGLESEPEFLDVEEAFQLKSRYEEGRLSLYWQIAPNYFLYHHSLKVETAIEGDLTDITSSFTSSPAVRKSDPYFGQVGVYYHHAELESTGLKTLEILNVSFQGCAEDGLCYPTQTKAVIVND